MSLISLKLKEDFNAIGEIKAGFRQKSKKAIRDYGRLIISKAQELAPIKTGAYSKSFYLVTQNYSNYEAAVRGVAEKNEEAKIQDSIEAPEDELELYLSSAVGYGLFVHEGTIRNVADYTLERAFAEVNVEPLLERLKNALYHSSRSIAEGSLSSFTTSIYSRDNNEEVDV